MQESKLVKYLGEMDSRMRERFRLFVTSPYFNQHEKTMELLDYIFRYLGKKPAKLERRKVFSALYKGEPYSEQSLYNIMSNLKKLYHRFLAQEQLEKQSFEEELLLLDSAFGNNQFDLLKNRGKQLHKRLTSYPYKDSDFYLTQFRYYKRLGYYMAQYEDRTKVSMLQDMMDHLDRYFLLEKLKNGVHLTANMQMVNSQFDLSILDHILEYYQARPEGFGDDHSIQLYYTILMSLRENENPAHYQRLKSLLNEQFDRFSPDEQGDLFTFANNYCVRRINLGDSNYQQELFELYKQGVTTGLALTNGILDEWLYKNITVLGCELKEFEWTQQFLEEYRSKLAPHRQENAYNYNMAHLYYTTKRYHNALDHLLLVRFSDVKYHLNYNSLLLATYYALGDSEALLSLIDTFRIYVIRNKKIPTDQKRGYTNFLRFAKKLTVLRQQPNSFGKSTRKEKVAKLYEQIRQTDNVMNRFWLEKACIAEAGDAIEALAEAKAAAEAEA